MYAIVHAADVQDRDGGMLLMASLFGLFPFLLKLYADSGYRGLSSSGAENLHRPILAEGLAVDRLLHGFM